MIRRTLSEIARMAGGELQAADGGQAVLGVSKDTRTLLPGQLYVPLIGERFDGHDYASEALAKGAAASLWQRDHANPPENAPLILVDDALQALQRLAVAYLGDTGAKVVAITGSNGKTTTKDFVASVLGTGFQVHKTAGNLNGDIGMPLTLLEMPEDTEIVVLEMGMRGRGEIELLSTLARPQVAVLTNIGESHLERLGSRENIARAKLEILSGLQPDGLFVYNGDEPLIAAHLPEAVRPASYGSVRFGLAETNDLFPTGVHLDGNGTHFTIGGEETPAYFIPLLGTHNVVNALAAVAVGRHFGLSDANVAKGLRKTQPTGMRIELVRGKTGLTLLNDAYNASPTSVRASLALFRQMKGFARKIVVLGDMLELGPDEIRLHREIGALLSADDFDYVFTYGQLARHLAEAALETFPPNRVKAFDDKGALAGEIASFAIPQDIVLVKGSRGMRLEEVVERLAAAEL